MKVHFKGIKADKSKFQSKIEVNSIDDFKQIMNNANIKVLNYRIVKNKPKRTFKKLSKLELSNFSDKLSLLLKSGLSLDKSLLIVKQTIKNKQLMKVIDQIIYRLNLGNSFSSALDEYNYLFPDIFIAMIKGAEKVGNLQEVMAYLAIYYQKEHKLHQKMSTALIYPSILCSISVLIFVMLVLFVIPKFEDILYSMNLTDIPKLTIYIFKFAKFFKDNLLYIILLICIMYLIIKIYSKNKKNRLIDYLKIKIPILGRINQTIFLSQFSRNLVLLYSNGLSLFESLKETTTLINNKYLKNKTCMSLDSVLKGSSLSTSLNNTKVFPHLLIEMIEVGEQTNNLKTILHNLSKYYEEETDLILLKATQIIEPLIIIIMAIVVCIVIVSVFVPMFGVMDGFIEV
ncbi:MAG: type II secretion system F family protein [Bacilli bacterium]